MAAACLDGVVSGSEECDDGNLVDTDGCTSLCRFTCSASSDCADANVCNGAETCTSPGTTASRCVAGTPPADGASCGTGRICRAGDCTTPGCGDGIVSGTEQCDDANTTNGDGCDNTCTWTCSVDADCSDGNVCNGAEVCTSGGTLLSRCGPGMPPSNGTSCGGSNICVSGSCIAARCGDGLVSGTEQCDDANTTNADGCDNTCTWTCSVDADCSDGNVCNGAEVCTSGGTLLSRCGPGMPAPRGTPCGGAGTCSDGVCCATPCGGLCESCAAADTGLADGVCAPIPPGMDPANECPTSAPSTCGTTGVCDGARACALYPAGTVCAAPTCSGGTASPPRTCSGTGDCSPATSVSCAPYVSCAGASCATSCAVNADCTAGHVCAAGACRLGLGAPCSAASQCASGFCVDGVCCNSTCTGLCRTCNSVVSTNEPGTCGTIECADPDNECPGTSFCDNAGRCSNICL